MNNLDYVYTILANMKEDCKMINVNFNRSYSELDNLEGLIDQTNFNTNTLNDLYDDLREVNIKLQENCYGEGSKDGYKSDMRCVGDIRKIRDFYFYN